MTKYQRLIDEAEFDDDLLDGIAIPAGVRRVRQPSRAPRARSSHSEVVAEVAEPIALEGGFNPTYQPARYEKIWLLDSLRSFYEEHIIVDVLAQVKGGKEASVYRCAPGREIDDRFVAAKVYRPRQFRNLRNDALYRAGRAILTGDGRAVKKSDHRIMRAIGKKTAFGAQVQHTSWLMYEYTTLERLHAAGAAVPRPFAANDNAILMSYHGDERRAAPTLNEVSLERDEAAALFEEVMRNVELMLTLGLVHGDLSAYNILYWEGAITIIDFPQVTDSHANRDAHAILQRDITRVCEYFARQGVRSDPVALTEGLWSRYVNEEPDELMEEGYLTER